MRIHPDYVPIDGSASADLSDPLKARAEMEAALAHVTPPRADPSDLSIRDLVLPSPGGPLRARLYVRHQASAPAPVVAYFHGGGFVMGGLDTDDDLCRFYAREADCAVLSLDYRLAPEHPYPAALDDALTCLRWLDTVGSPEGLDAARVAVAGCSAGGALAAATALAARDRTEPLRLALLNSPPLDDRCDTPSMAASETWTVMGRRVVRQTWANWLAGQAPCERAIPARARTLSGLAPVFITMGAVEPMLDEAIAFARRIVDEGGLAELHVVPGAPHVFERVRGSPTTQRALALQAAALAHALS